jgi:Arc/MetJ-type ribon-helix-helix transcriptional regulator
MATKEVKKGSEKKDAKERGKAVIMACCPDGEGKVVSPELKDEILLKLGKGLGDRGNVVMTRLDDADLKHIDALVEVEAFKSRSEAVAYFIHEGIKARKDLFEKVEPTVDKIRQLKREARENLEKLRQGREKQK